MPERGRLVVLEGGEGSGKSTQARLLADRRGSLLTREPGGTLLGEQLRALLLEPRPVAIEARAELLMMVAARAQHVTEVIAPALREGTDVVSDRFAGSTLAYQSFGRGLPLAEVQAACDLAAQGIRPDLVVLLDVSPEAASSRRQGVPDRIEAAGPAFHARVRAGFRTLATCPGWVLVDGEGTLEEVAHRIEALVEDRLGAPRHGGLQQGGLQQGGLQQGGLQQGGLQ